MHCVSSRLRPHHHQYSHYGAFTYTVSASAATGPPAFVMRTVSAKLGRARAYGRIFRQLRTVDRLRSLVVLRRGFQRSALVRCLRR